ncbi:cellobiose phosphorylase [Gorillibacterium sp. sgz5001074]|uniref:cellobiose phosphorylase n=1 Tax=Gorillibacterium sp. sgz5001074 TaxID=3446695 RepID=UPI003F6649EA
MAHYSFDGADRFRILGYNQSKPFAGFLPGIAGLDGIPMWVFYVNRGQGIASFGVQDKDHAIMEFQPAHKAYQLTPLQGFRTFIKWKRGEAAGFWEPYAGRREQAGKEILTVEPNGLSLKTEDPASELQVETDYYTLPGEEFAALVRHVVFRNSGKEPVELEVLDGMPAVLPYGTGNAGYKEIGNTLKAWMDVYNLENGIPYYRMRSSTEDSAEVQTVTAGHFLLSFLSGPEGEEDVPLVVDAERVFGCGSSLREPDSFLEQGWEAATASKPVTANKVPCGFSGFRQELAPGGTVELYTMIGHTADIGRINGRRKELSRREYLRSKKQEAARLADEVTSAIRTRSGMERFDAYARQCYLDNVLRGGLPLVLGRRVEAGAGTESAGGVPVSGRQAPAVYHVYSRKHGDLERDYNFFSLEPSYYSQGNGNFRDVNQNRRMDVFFEPEVGDTNVKVFMNLLQTDGYNPLVVQGSKFRLADPAIPLGMVEEDRRQEVRNFLEAGYTPGGLLRWMERKGIRTGCAHGEWIGHVLAYSRQEMEAAFGEGYWIDHWTYNMDQIESYLAVYPDRLEELLFGDGSYAYYDSPAFVRPRALKTVLDGDKVRQYGALEELPEKEALLESRGAERCWVRTAHGHGAVYRTHLYEKLVCLALLKFATMDPEGLGIEMEAGKPGWNDSLNGLPGLFGSGFNETAELKRLVDFLMVLHERLPAESLALELPIEMAELLEAVERELDEYGRSAEPDRDFRYWDRVSGAREKYRESVRFGLDGRGRSLAAEVVLRFLRKCAAKVNQAFVRAKEIGKGLYPAYFYYEAVEFERLMDTKGQLHTDAKGRPYVRVTRFRRCDLPPFLEGAARAMKVLDSEVERRSLYEAVRESGIYDRKLRMYKVNAPLAGESHELGRAAAFTPGWLENESVFLHMEYKYLLELLKGGLYEEFYEDIRHAWIPFLDPAVYGRSTLENSSFIASSANPDPSLHGTGFVARLSGSTAEFLQMWQLMMTGPEPFRLKDGLLELQLLPLLPAWLFDGQGEVAFRFLGCCEVIYANPERKNTFGADGVSPLRLEIRGTDGSVRLVDGPVLAGEAALAVREKRAASIRVLLGSPEAR